MARFGNDAIAAIATTARVNFHVCDIISPRLICGQPQRARRDFPSPARPNVEGFCFTASQSYQCDRERETTSKPGSSTVPPAAQDENCTCLQFFRTTGMQARIRFEIC